MGNPGQGLSQGTVDDADRQTFKIAGDAHIRNEGTFAHVVLLVSTGAIALSLTLVLGRKEPLVLRNTNWLKYALVLFGVTTVLVIAYHQACMYFWGWWADFYYQACSGGDAERSRRKASLWGRPRLILQWGSALTVVAAIILLGVFVLSNVDSVIVPSARTTISCPDCSSRLEIEVRARKLKPTPPSPPAKQP